MPCLHDTIRCFNRNVWLFVHNMRLKNTPRQPLQGYPGPEEKSRSQAWSGRSGSRMRLRVTSTMRTKLVTCASGWMWLDSPE